MCYVSQLNVVGSPATTIFLSVWEWWFMLFPHFEANATLICVLYERPIGYIQGYPNIVASVLLVVGYQ